MMQNFFEHDSRHKRPEPDAQRHAETPYAPRHYRSANAHKVFKHYRGVDRTFWLNPTPGATS